MQNSKHILAENILMYFKRVMCYLFNGAKYFYVTVFVRFLRLGC